MSHPNDASTVGDSSPIHEITEMPAIAKEDATARCCSSFCFSPRCDAHRQSSLWVLFWMCCAVAVQGMLVNVFVNVAISTIEKRFDLPSKSTGLIASSYDIASLVASIPIPYLGSRKGASKPRWLGWGLVLMGIGSLMFALPHLMVGPYIQQAGDLGASNSSVSSNAMLCSLATTSDGSCNSEEETGLSHFLHIFFFGQFLSGLGAVPLFSIGVAYLDESVRTPQQSSIHLAWYYTWATIGPAMGYGIGGQFLKQYIDFPSIDPQEFGLSPSSDLWLGAWWVGFLFCGVASILVAIPILMLPQVISGGILEEKDETRVVSTEVVASGIISLESVDDFKTMSLSLLKNKLFASLSISKAFDGFLILGFAPFIPKLIEIQFGYSASSASLTVGAIAIPAGAGATMLSGWLIKRFSISYLNIIRMSFLMSTMALGMLLAMLFHCPDLPFAGINHQYDSLETDSLPSLVASCNVVCGCEEASYAPVCGANGVSYFSPCHAGCPHGRHDKLLGKEVYSNCECVAALPSAGNFTSRWESLVPGEAVTDKCSLECIDFSYITAFLFLIFFAVAFTSIPNISLTLRSVQHEERSYGMGLQTIMFRALGTIPASIVIGFAIDRACLLWDAKCQHKGSCLAYDNFSISRNNMAVAMSVKMLSTLGYLLAWCFCSPDAFQEAPHTDKTKLRTKHKSYVNEGFELT